MLGLLNTKWISGVFLQKYIMYFLCMRPYANLEGLRVKCYTAWLLKARGLVDLGLMGWIWLSEVFCLSTHTLALLNSWQTFKNWEILIKIWFPALESSLSWQFWAYILTWQQHLEGSVPVWATVTSTPYYIWGGQWPFTAAAVHPFLSFFFGHTRQHMLPWWLKRERICLQCRHPGSVPGFGRSPGEETGNPLQYSWLENSMDREAWQATVHGMSKSRT